LVMSSSRWGRNWADLEEDDVVDMPKSKTRFETEADSKGIKTVIEYVERDGKTFKVTKKVRQRKHTRKVNLAVEERKKWDGFGRGNPGATDEHGDIISQHPTKVQEEIPIEATVKIGAARADAPEHDAEDAFYNESINIADELVKEKKVWTDINKAKQEERDAEMEKPAPGGKGDAKGAAPGAPAGASGRYVPPSLRGGGKDGKGDGKGDNRDNEATLRVFNLSEDAKDGDLAELFGQFGRTARVFLAKHQEGELAGQSKGFAFITYYNREDGERAIAKLNGHGYDNLIMKVEWAKPRV